MRKPALLQYILALSGIMLCLPGFAAPACTAEAFAASQKFPKLAESCPEDRESGVLLDAEGDAALQRQLNALSRQWWQIPTEELNACAIRQQVGALDETQQADLENAATFGGAGDLRLFGVLDPCSQLSNVYALLQSGSGGTVATRIAEQLGRHADGAPFSLLGIAPIQGKQVALLENCDSFGYGFSCRYWAFQADFTSGAFEPYGLFQTARGALSMIYSESMRHGW